MFKTLAERETNNFYLFIESYYIKSLGLKEKTNLKEGLTSVKLVRYFRHHFELKSISLKFRQQCFSIITCTVIRIEIF